MYLISVVVPSVLQSHKAAGSAVPHVFLRSRHAYVCQASTVAAAATGVGTDRGLSAGATLRLH